MTVLRIALLVLHILGLAAIVGPFFEQLKASTKRITTLMVWGARAQIVTGLALVGVAFATDHQPDHRKLAVKLVLALLIAAVAEMTRKRQGNVDWAYWTVGAATIANVIVAVAWR